MSPSRAEHNPGISLFEHLRSHLGARFVVFDCTKATLVHVSHTIEDLILRERLPALLLTGFQESSHWRAETERYRALADIAHQVCIFAGGAPGEDSHAREIRVTLRGDDPLRQEWFVCALTPQLSFVLCGQDQHSLVIDEATRQFQTFWTFEPEVVSEVLDLLEAVLSHYRPERLADLQRARAQLPPAPPDARLVSIVLREMVRFEDQLQRTLREREARYKIVSELATDYLYTIKVTPEQQLIYFWSANGLTGLTGYAAHEIPEQGELMPLAHPDDAPLVQAHLAALLAGREDVCEFRIIARDGETRWVRDYARPIIDRRTQRVSQIIGAASNISAQKRDQAALRAERDRFVKIAETVPGVVLAFRMQPDGSFTFPYASPRIHEIYGLPPEALAEDGAVVLQFWDPDDVARILASVEQSRQQMTPWRDEFRVHNPLRGELWIEGHSIPQAEPDGSTIWYGVLTDITARKRAEQAIQQSHAALEERVDARTAELRAALERAQALYAITNDAIASDNMVEALQRAIERASESISADRMLMLIIDHEQRSVEHLLYAEHGTGYINTEVSYDELMSGLTGWAIRERRPAISLKGDAPDPRESLSVQLRRAELEHGAIVVLPLIYLNEVFGTLTAIRRPEEPDFSAEDIDLLSATAGQIALAYARMRLTAHLQRANAALSHEVHERTALGLQLQQQADRANALAALSRALAEAGRDLQPLFAIIAAQTVQLIGDACVLTLLTPDGQSMEVTAIDHADPEGAAILRTLYPSGPYPADSGLAGQVAQSGQPLLVAQVAPEHVRAQIKPEYLPYLDHFNIESLLIVPLHVHGRVMGTLGVTRNQPGRPYSADDQAFLQDLADRAGLAIENARLFAAAELARAEAERASHAKDAFLATMSHELRTPLNAILGYSESLHEQIYGPLTPRQHSAIDAVETAGRHLLTLISDILDLSKIEAGQLELQIQPVLLRDVCNASLLFVREQALKKRLRLSFQIDSHEATLAVDPGRLKQMLVNLLSNAVKFTPDGGAVGLDVGVDAIAGTARLTVHDSGIGIASGDLGRLFQPFQQLDSRLNRQHEGTGLGLALVRRLAELHSGSVVVESQVGQGSRFTITLPYHGAAPTETPPQPAVAPPDLATAQAAPRARILLAEDNESSIVAISDYLHTHGYALTIARNGHEALAKAEEVCPDLILMDIQMPGMDGLTAIRRLRAQPAHASIPIIALTALAMPGDKERCLAAGATAYMSKPVRLRTLSEMIAQLLGA